MSYPVGSCTALITPFKNGKLDEAQYHELIKRQIKLGIDIVSPMGTTGESPTVVALLLLSISLIRLKM